MNVNQGELQAVLQKLADEISLQGRHLEAQRFSIQLLHTVLEKNGSMRLNSCESPAAALLSATYGPNGEKPNSEVFSIVSQMLFGQMAEIVPFPSRTIETID